MGCDNYAMCLTGPSLTVAIVTIHVALRTSHTSQNVEIIRIGKLLGNFCKKKTNAPKIAVCGLNPHAGENGAGMEDIELIIPAIEELNRGGYHFLALFHPTPFSAPQWTVPTMQFYACITSRLTLEAARFRH